MVAGRPQTEHDFWITQRNMMVNYGSLKKPEEYGSFCSEALQYTYATWPNDSWVETMSSYNAMDKDRCWQNGTVPLLLAQHNMGDDHAFEVSTIVTYWAIEGLFRHNVGNDAVALTLAHIEAMLTPTAAAFGGQAARRLLAVSTHRRPLQPQNVQSLEPFF